jgi:hypothetical protein
MSKLKICQKCKTYTLKSEHCQEKTKEAGYKYITVRKSIKQEEPNKS